MKKELGFVGLGRMGLNMVTHLAAEGYRVVGYNRSEGPRAEAEKAGVETVNSLAEMVATLSAPRVVWLMVSSKAVDAVLAELTPLLETADTIVDGGNSFYQDSLRRHRELKEKELNFLDCGTSGGMFGARHGASLMVGGAPEVYAAVEHIFATLAVSDGYARVGNEGARHFEDDPQRH